MGQAPQRHVYLCGWGCTHGMLIFGARVLWLYISVKKIVLVHVGQASEVLPGNRSNIRHLPYGTCGMFGFLV